MRAVVVVAAGLQPVYLGCYGSELVPTPTADHWAATGVTFDNHFSDCPEPTAARRAWRTGRLQMPGDKSHHPVDLLTGLRAAGVRTARVGPAMASDDAWADGWDASISVGRRTGSDDFKPTRRAVRQAIDRLADAPAALLWIEVDTLIPPWTVADDVLAHFFHEPALEDEPEPDEGTDALPPVEPLEPWTGDLPTSVDPADETTFQRIQRTYAAAVAALDDGLGKLWKDCARSGWGDDAVWLLTSDAGLPLGEHGPAGRDAVTLHEEAVHLPLLLRWPKGQYAGLRVRDLTQPPDLAATLLGLFGASLPSTNDPRAGRSLLALAREVGLAIRAYAACAVERDASRLWSIRSHDLCLVASDGPADVESTRRLFLKPDDRWEFNDVAQQSPDEVERLEQAYRDIAGGAPAATPVAN
jgi:arylsulfatase A-like enzyme